MTPVDLGGGGEIRSDDERGGGLGGALGATPSGTPMSYRAEDREFIVLAYGAGEESGLIGPALPTSP